MNVSAWRNEYYNLFRYYKPDFMFLQEIRHVVKSTLNYNLFCKLRGDNCSGGGVATAVVMDYDKLIPEPLSQLELQFLRVTH
jgi:hypothetical protein